MPTPTVPPNPDPWLKRNTDGTVSPYRPAITIQVYRLTGTATYQLLDNLRCEWIEHRAGIDPGVAGFRYVFNNLDNQAPQNVQQALDTSSTLPKTVNQGDRIVVKAIRPDNTSYFLFDGFAYDFDMDLAPVKEEVDFLGVGVAKRLFDSTIAGAYVRDSNNPTSTDPSNTQQTDVVARFNPRIRNKSYGNATPNGVDSTMGSFHAPVFMDYLLPAGAMGPRFWTLAMAANYLVYRHNNAQTYVQNPVQGSLDNLLVSREPIDGMTFDPGNPTTYTAVDITVPDKIITGRDWPLCLFEMIRDKGFGLNFQLNTVSGAPQTSLNIYLNQLGTPKSIYLQLQGATLDPLYSNTMMANMARRCSDVVNQWTVNGALQKFEASFILAPLFPMQASDGTPANLPNYNKNSPNFNNTNIDAYRLYGVDEIGEGHYAIGSNTPLSTLPNFSAILGSNYAKRRRPAKGGELITLDPRGQPLRWNLYYSTDYTGPGPGLWDGSGTWKPVESTRRLRDDRLGIYCTATDPNNWSVGRDPVSGGQVVLRGVESQCAMTAGKSFTLRLTCCIEGDASVNYTATRRGTSPIQFNITRNIDRRDFYAYEAIAPKSMNNTTSAIVVSRDDTPLAQAEAIQCRSASEAGIMEGQIVIPYITDYYRIGDRINSLAGRGLGFRSDGITTASVPVYPVVESRRWEFTENSQRTVLRLSDEAVDRYQLERKIRR